MKPIEALSLGWRTELICFDAMNLASLVIIADPHDVPIGLDESLGFVRDHAMWYVESQSRDDAPRG